MRWLDRLVRPLSNIGRGSVGAPDDEYSDMLAVYRLDVPRPGDYYDEEAIVVGSVDALEGVQQWLSSGSPDGIRDAVELLGYVLRDLNLILEHQRGHAREDVASESLPLPRSRTDEHSTAPPG